MSSQSRSLRYQSGDASDNRQGGGIAVSKAEQEDSGPNTLRKGKWTAEEENYANKIIDLFNQGLLPIVSGTTLRTYLSDKLRCDPMRITKKFAGASCIGKQVFQPFDEGMTSAESSSRYISALKESEAELHRLEQLFLAKISSKSSSSTAAAAGGASSSASTRAPVGNVPARGFYSKFEHASPSIADSSSQSFPLSQGGEVIEYSDATNAISHSSGGKRSGNRRSDSRYSTAQSHVKSVVLEGSNAGASNMHNVSSPFSAQTTREYTENDTPAAADINYGASGGEESEGTEEAESEGDLGQRNFINDSNNSGDEENFLEAEEYIAKQKQKQQHLQWLLHVQQQHQQQQRQLAQFLFQSGSSNSSSGAVLSARRAILSSDTTVKASAAIALGAAHLTSSQSSFLPSKRVRSAPNLSYLDALSRAEKGGPTRSLHIPAAAVAAATTAALEAVALSRSHSTNAGPLGATATSAASVSAGDSSVMLSAGSLQARKRSHSVMALMDFEKLVADNRAADDFFLDFVHSINRTPGATPAPAAMLAASSMHTSDVSAQFPSSAPIHLNAGAAAQAPRGSQQQQHMAPKGGYLRSIREEAEISTVRGGRDCTSIAGEFNSLVNSYVTKIGDNNSSSIANGNSNSKESNGSISSMIGAMESSSIAQQHSVIEKDVAGQKTTFVDQSEGAVLEDTEDHEGNFF